MFEYAAELLIYVAVYPALITVVLVVVLFHHNGSRLIAGSRGTFLLSVGKFTDSNCVHDFANGQ